MFWVYRKNIGGRKTDRYFQDLDNAKNALKDDLYWIKEKGGRVTRHRDYYNKEKGIPVYFYEGNVSTSTDTKDEKFSLCLLDSYFED